ncbi:MAG: hypothetical protein FJ108_16490 [Deltaproteobacteria bacterium]|nr:hypothetical protein [Deltaproteobacteria bacterium]
MNGSLLSTQATIVIVMSVLSLAAICVPLYRGLSLSARAFRATRLVPRPLLEKSLQLAAKGRADSIAVLMLRVLAKSLRSPDARTVASDFVVDASRQYVMNEYEASYSRPISMYANLLPPVGLAGNAIGMLILLVSKHMAGTALELGALGLALSSTIFALIGYALLEAIKPRLYGRMLRCLDEVVSLQRTAEERSAATSAAAVPSPA